MPKEKKLGDEVYQRSKFIHQILVVPKKQIFNWSLWFPAILVVFINFLSHSKKVFFKFMIKNSMGFFSVSVSAISMILAAIAIIIVIYNKNDLHLIVTNDDKTFEGFIFPYRWGAALWGVVAGVSLMSNVIYFSVSVKIATYAYLFWLFMVLYSVFYTIYIIGEVVQHIIMASTVEDK